MCETFVFDCLEVGETQTCSECGKEVIIIFRPKNVCSDCVQGIVVIPEKPLSGLALAAQRAIARGVPEISTHRR